MARGDSDLANKENSQGKTKKKRGLGFASLPATTWSPQPRRGGNELDEIGYDGRWATDDSDGGDHGFLVGVAGT